MTNVVSSSFAVTYIRFDMRKAIFFGGLMLANWRSLISRGSTRQMPSTSLIRILITIATMILTASSSLWMSYRSESKEYEVSTYSKNLKPSLPLILL